jgi:cyanophycin synthetase
MEIKEIKAYHAPNIYSLYEPIVRIKIKLGKLSEVPTKDIGNINEKIIQLFPGIIEHKCSKGYVGGFVERLKEGTYLAHVTEHLCLETQKLLGYDLKYGKARQVEDDVYNVIFSCVYTEIGKACGIFVINTINALIEKQELDMESGLQNLRKLCIKYNQGISTSAIIREAKKEIYR